MLIPESLCGDFACGCLAAGVVAITCEFDRVARIAAILAAIFAVLHGSARAGGMCALVLLFHNSPRSLGWMHPVHKERAAAGYRHTLLSAFWVADENERGRFQFHQEAAPRQPGETNTFSGRLHDGRDRVSASRMESAAIRSVN